MFLRRRGDGPDRFLAVRIALIFLAAGVWVGGVVTGRDAITGVAIGILLVALVLQIVGRRSAR